MENGISVTSHEIDLKLPVGELSERVVMPLKAKWDGALTDSSGFVAVPMSLLRLQTKFQLTATDLVVLINLLAHWWDPARAVYPRSTTIALRMGVAKRTVQRSTQKMINDGLIKRDILVDGRRVFKFDTLVERLASELPHSLSIKGREGWDK